MTLSPPGPTRRAALGGGTALAVLLAGAVGAAAAPARADTPPPAVIEVGGLGPDALARPAGALTEAHFRTYQFAVWGDRPDGAPITGAEITVDVAGAAGVAEFRFRPECRVTGTLATCPVAMPDGTGDPETHVPFFARPRLGTAAGDSGVVRATVRADNARTVEETPSELKVAVADRDSLTLGGFPKGISIEIPPGGRAAAPFDLTNTGARPLNRVTLSVSGFDGDDTVAFPGDHENCWYRTKDPKDPRSARIGVQCEFDTALRPGTTYRTSPGLAVAMVGLAEYGRIDFFASTRPAERTGVRGRSAPLALVPGTSPAPPRVPVPADTYTVDRPPVIGVHSPPAADGAAVGASVRTAVGRVATARVGVLNRGRAPLTGPVALVEVPPGVDVVRPDPRCRPEPWSDRWNDAPPPTFGDRPGDAAPVPSGAVYRCADPKDLAPGERRLFSFALKPVRALDGAEGVVFDPSLSPYDPRQRAKVAFLTVTAAGAGTASPSPSASPTPGDTASPGPSPTHTPAPTSTSTPGGGSGALASTGSDDAPALIGAAGALVVSGALLFLAVRRRSSRQH
ncbi:LPXTG cell wall anchor domain-containing protein [Streptomyces sp. TRM76323]|uniref:LPXTG cell wall anchor domain-containing protein n=1 Tax=Streptomyces tamarix TaxID=3078565 RepID=A0ABU3QJT6_9ACTN|nr:LPXTG cell wall anchor domain-containing protein [Streptomyces tamarix]MDT9682699.1 LPXTG cell wall anchor domain-containing protein [Streptomyces tamarix]